MREYTVKTYDNICWDSVDKAPIDNFGWLTGYEPECYAQVAILKDKGLCVKLTAHESNPLAEKKNFNDQVCEDSCLEFFASFNSSAEYVNIEMNSIGTCLAHMHYADGTTAVINEIIDIPRINAAKTENKWSVELMLTFEEIKKLFPNVTLQSGSQFNANFYKCGDNTDKPHYGMWNKVDYEKPSFHQPTQFGRLTVE